VRRTEIRKTARRKAFWFYDGAILVSFSNACEKKFLLDAADRRHLLWGAVTALELETCEYISCRISRRRFPRRNFP
jgi:hypothetical protein